ncbi:TRAP transporter small permease subunit [Kordiimonas aquimaris]|uniref:TRAP transporter small permease subunit n=1 Tax=Kordiimonas aquimaris TaxID=707591 RepID=UPI0021CF8AB2|nr:TRAP transporter small permease subunit [Kordiimonas aquimaris]
MQHILKIADFIDGMAVRAGKLAAWFLIALVIVIMLDVTLRHWFVIGSTKLQEMEWHLHGALFLLCLGWTYSANGHVRIELFSEKWNPRTRAIIELLGCMVFLLPYIATIVWFGFDYVEYSLAYNEASPSPTGLTNRWLIKAAIPVGFLLLACSAFSKALKAIVFLFGSASLAPHTGFSGDKTRKASITLANTVET